MLYLPLRSIAFKGKLCPAVLLKIGCHDASVFMNELSSGNDILLPWVPSPTASITVYSATIDMRLNYRDCIFSQNTEDYVLSSIYLFITVHIFGESTFQEKQFCFFAYNYFAACFLDVLSYHQSLVTAKNKGSSTSELSFSSKIEINFNLFYLI